jgi:hypothetical protein
MAECAVSLRGSYSQESVGAELSATAKIALAVAKSQLFAVINK